MTSTTYQVTGMTCEHCVRAVTEEIGNVPGVRAVTVALVPGGASAVTVASEAPVAEDAIRAALDEAGEYRLAGDGGNPAAANGVTAPGSGLRADPAGPLTFPRGAIAACPGVAPALVRDDEHEHH